MSPLPEPTNNTVRPARTKSGGPSDVLGAPIPPHPPSPLPPPSAMASHTLTETTYDTILKSIDLAKDCGAGGFGKVLVVEHPTQGTVAMKKLHLFHPQSANDVRRHTLREAKIWQDLEHPHVLPFLGIFETPADLYLISPFVKNGSLSDYLNRNPAADRQAFLWEAARGIAYLHNRGIVHGDIKASNILVSDGIQALLCDFGLAKSEGTNTSCGLEGVGTIRFQSPELLINGGGKTFASDAWAFGMTIYEVLSGKIPFYEYRTDYSVIYAITSKEERPKKSPRQSLSGISYDQLWDVADGCWVRDPARRLSIQDIPKLQPNNALRIDPKMRLKKIAEEPIGAGVHGMVARYLLLPDTHSTGHGRRDSEEVAVRIIKSDAMRLENITRREIPVWAALNHVNVSKFIGYHFQVNTPTEGEAWLISPWQEQGSVCEYLKKVQLAPLARERLLFLQDACDGLGYMHTLPQPVIHGNIKGRIKGNVLVRFEPSKSRNIVVLCDFGLTAISTDSALAALQTECDFAGSTRWYGPELLDQDGFYRDAPSDMWAMGWLVWEVMTEKIPFHDITFPPAILKAICDRRLPNLKSIPPFESLMLEQLRRLVEHCWKPANKRATILEAQKYLRKQLKKYEPPHFPNEAAHSKSTSPTPNLIDGAWSRFKEANVLEKMKSLTTSRWEWNTRQPVLTSTHGITPTGELGVPDHNQIALSKNSTPVGGYATLEPSIVASTLGAHRSSGSNESTDRTVTARPPAKAVLGLGRITFSKRLIDGRDCSVMIASLRKTEAQPEDEVTKRLESFVAQNLLLSDHPSVVPIIASSRIYGEPCLISPWIEAKELDQYLLETTETDRESLVHDVVRGVTHLHNGGIVHSALKPSNILVKPPGVGILRGHGSAQLLGAEASEELYTMGFSPPDILLGKAPDFKSDVYSLACIILYILTGNTPYQTLSRAETIVNVNLPQRDRYLELEGQGHDGLWHLLSRSWDKDPCNRPQISEFANLLGVAVEIRSSLPATNTAEPSDTTRPLPSNPT